MCAVAYHLVRASGDPDYLVNIYSMNNGQVLHMLYCQQEVTQMCTPGTKDVLILSSILGSLYVYDLKNLELSNSLGDLNYRSLLEKKLEGFAELEEARKLKKI